MMLDRSSARRLRWRRALVVAGLLVAALTAGCTQAAPAKAPPTPTATRLDGTTYQLDVAPRQILLAGEAIYFTAGDSRGSGAQHIYRLDLETAGVRQVAASSYYAGGILDSYRLGLAADWLIYLETSPADNGRSWTLAGTHLVTGRTVVIDQAAQDQIGWPGPEVAAGGDWVVWTRKEAVDGAARSRIHVYNVQSGERRVLGEALDATRETWGWPDLHGNLLVLERDWMDPANPMASVELIDLETGEATRLSGPGPASEPSIDGRYVAWKAGLRFGQGQLTIYDLELGETRSVGLAMEYPQSGAGQVIGWSEGSSLVRVSTAGHGWQVLVPPGEGAHDPPAASVDGSRAAWVEPGGLPPGRVKLRVG